MTTTTDTERVYNCEMCCGRVAAEDDYKSLLDRLQVEEAHGEKYQKELAELRVRLQKAEEENARLKRTIGNLQLECDFLSDELNRC